MTQNLYEILGLSATAGPDEVKSAYRRLAQKYHPDKETGDAGKFKAIQHAYEVLSDPVRRKVYDETGDHGQGMPPPANNLFIETVQIAFAMVRDCSDVTQMDMWQLVANNIQESLEYKMRPNLKQAKRVLKKCQEFVQRTSIKDAELAGVFADVAKHEMQQAEAIVNSWQDNVKKAEEALKLLKGFSYRSDAPNGRQEAYGGRQMQEALRGLFGKQRW